MIWFDLAAFLLRTFVDLPDALKPDVVFDGWGTAVVFTIIWGAAYHYVTQTVPSRNQYTKNLDLIYHEILRNLRILSGTNPRFVDTGIYSQYKANVLNSLDEMTGEDLVCLYRIFAIIQVDQAAIRDPAIKKGLTEHLTGFCAGAKDIEQVKRDLLRSTWENTLSKLSNP